MKLLILTQYFPPETGAPQNRLYELAIRMQKQGVEVTILTAMPNYPHMKVQEAYRNKIYTFETDNNLKIHRSWIFAKKSTSLVLRMVNYFSFVFSSLLAGIVHTGKQDVILCESPPLFLGFTALILKTVKRSQLIFNVSDLWPESAEKLGLVTNKTFLNMATWLEKLMYRKSALITGQTQGIVQNISRRFPHKKVFWLKNGVDPDYFKPIPPDGAFRQLLNIPTDTFICLYAGIIGYAQGLDVILDAAKQIPANKNIHFVMVGSGPEKERLQIRINRENIHKVTLYKGVTKQEMPHIIADCNCSVIPLRKLDLFKGAIPSKIFENLAMALPIVLGVDGEARELFINQGQSGVYFEPESAQQLAQCVISLESNRSKAVELGKNGRNFIHSHFNRNTIATDFMNELRQVTGQQ